MDAGLRLALRAPGLVVDLIDGRPVIDEGIDPAAVYPLVRAAARHPEAHLALEPGLHHHVHGEHVLAFEVRKRTAFAIGGLNVPSEERIGFLRAFRSSMDQRGLTRQMLFPLREDELTDAHAAGFRALQVGVEAWIDLPDFTVAGKAGEHVRQMRNRARRRGVQVAEVAVGDHRDAFSVLHARWLQSKRPSWRMKLLVGSPGLERPFDRRFFAATTDDRVEAFCTVLPGAPGEWGVDVMCREPDAVPGTMERLLLHVIEVLRDEGALALSLGPCPMAGVPVDGRLRSLKWVFGYLFRSWWGNQVFGFRNLYRFKHKFRPRWEPVFLGASPRLGPMTLYRGCRMWGLY
jgi:phosphatidylglycerol lysyltransferase